MPKSPPTFYATRKPAKVHNPYPQEDTRIRGRRRQTRNARLFFNAPLCGLCEAEGVTKEVDEWDHIIPLWKGGIDHESNMAGMCFEHHRKKSASEAKERALLKRR